MCSRRRRFVNSYPLGPVQSLSVDSSRQEELRQAGQALVFPIWRGVGETLSLRQSHGFPYVENECAGLSDGEHTHDPSMRRFHINSCYDSFGSFDWVMSMSATQGVSSTSATISRNFQYPQRQLTRLSSLSLFYWWCLMDFEFVTSDNKSYILYIHINIYMYKHTHRFIHIHTHKHI